MRRLRSTSFLAAFVFLYGMVAVPLVLGQQEAARPHVDLEAQARAKAKQDEIRKRIASGPDQFGINCCQILQIPAASFVPQNAGAVIDRASFGYAYLSTNSSGFTDALWAAVTLPSGAVLDFLDLYYQDIDPGNDITATLRAYTGADSANPPGFFDISVVSSTLNPGYGYVSTFASGTINNDVEYNGGAQYTVIISLPSFYTGNFLGFKAVDIWWHRQVSPAPGAASFNDVPTNHPFFQYIEALKASGITGGCQASPPLCCPDNPLPRGQMAVFLSKGLGLYWPY